MSIENISELNWNIIVERLGKTTIIEYFFKLVFNKIKSSILLFFLYKNYDNINEPHKNIPFYTDTVFFENHENEYKDYIRCSVFICELIKNEHNYTDNIEFMKILNILQYLLMTSVIENTHHWTYCFKNNCKPICDKKLFYLEFMDKE